VDNVGGVSRGVASVAGMTSDQNLVQHLGDPRRAAAEPGRLRRLLYEDFDVRHAGAPPTGAAAIDVLLNKAVLALRLIDDDEARGLVVRATGVPPGSGAPAPAVLWQAVGLLWAQVVRSVEADQDGDYPWFDALASSVVDPGDDISVVAVGTLQAVASRYALPGGILETITDLVDEYLLPDPTGIVERVLTRRSGEVEAVLDVLRLLAEVEETMPREEEDEDDYD